MGHPSDQQSSSVHVETLGRLAIHSGGDLQTKTMLAPVRSAVLVVLALERDISREEVMALLWPESPERRGRHSLNQALHRLRTDLGTGWLRTHGDRILATEALTTDVQVFLDAIEVGDLVRAIEMFRGRFLQGARLADTRPLEEWMDRWESRLATWFRDTCREIIEGAAVEADLDAALRVTRRWLAIEPHSEEGHHRLTELLAATGNVPEALHHVEEYQRLLAEDDLELPESMVTLSHRLRATPSTPSPLAITQGRRPPEGWRSRRSHQRDGAREGTGDRSEDAPGNGTADTQEDAPGNGSGGATEVSSEGGTPHTQEDAPGNRSGDATETSSEGGTPHTQEDAPKRVMDDATGDETGKKTGEGTKKGARKKAEETVGASTSAKPGTRRIFWGSALGAMVVIVAATGIIRAFDDPGTDSAHRVVLVAPLQNYTGDSTLTPLGRMAADWIGQTAARQGIRVVPTIEVMEGAGAGAGPLSEEAQARAIANRLQVDLLVTGHYTLEGQDLVLRAEVSDLNSSRVWGPLPSIRAPVDSPTVALRRLEQRVTGLLVSQVGPGFAVEPPTVLHPPTLDAYETFLRGVDRFLQGKYRQALPHLAQAFEQDPSFARAALLAASAHLNLGDLRGADSIARLLARREAELAPYEAAHLASLREILAGHRAAALDAATEAAKLAPGGPITAVAALFALELGHPTRALELMERIDPHQGWAARVPEYWDARTRILHTLERHQEELRVARSPEAAAWPLHSRFWQVRALAALGQPAGIREIVEAASALPRDPRLDFGRFLSDAALEIAAHGDTALARELFSASVGWYEDRSAQGDADAHLPAKARVLFLMGENRRALEHYQQLATILPDRLPVQGSLAVLYARLGEADSARSCADTLRDPPFVNGAASIWRARMEAALGNTEAAVDLVRQALQEGFGQRFELHTDPDLGPILRQRPHRTLLLPGG